MKYRVSISGEAYRTLSDQVLFLARLNPQTARKLKAKLIKSIQSLESFPFRCRPLDENDPYCAYRLMIVSERYGIIYMVQETEVYVEYVLDLRQDYQWLLKRFLGDN